MKRCVYLLLSVFALSACAGKSNDLTASWTPEKIYNEAKSESANGAFDKAVGLFEKLETRAIGTPLAQQAQIEKAFAQYKGGEQAQALITIDRFLRLHPASPLLDYALYLRGLVNFNDNLGFLSRISGQNLNERDQKASKESYASFNELVSRFPESKYAKDSQARMAYILNTLAAYEVSVARFYASRGAHLAAANRAQAAIIDYPNSLAVEQALEIMIHAYNTLGIARLRDDAKRVMASSFPNNKMGR
jgi:outer membrane protein assembly factor BamD